MAYSNDVTIVTIGLDDIDARPNTFLMHAWFGTPKFQNGTWALVCCYIPLDIGGGGGLEFLPDPFYVTD